MFPEDVDVPIRNPHYVHNTERISYSKNSHVGSNYIHYPCWVQLYSLPSLVFYI